MTSKDKTNAGDALLDDCGIAVMVAKDDENGLIVLACNEANAQMMGHPHKNLVGSRLKNIIFCANTDTQAMEQAMAFAQSGQSGIFASCFKRQDGKPFAARCMVTGHFDENGTFTHYVFVSTPINPDNPGLLCFGTKGLLAQAEQVGGTGAWRYDFVTEEFICSDNCYALHGLSAKSENVDRILELVPLSERARIDKASAQCRETGQPFEINCVFYRDDGSRRDGLIHAQPEFNNSGEVIALLGVLRDETEVQSLRRKQEMFLSAAKIGFIEINLQAETITYSAEGGAIISGSRVPGKMSIEEWKGRVHPDDFDETWKSFNDNINAENGGFFTRRYRFLTEDGAYRWVEAHATARFSPSSDAPIILGTIADVEAQIRADKELGDIHARLDLAVDSAALGLWSLDLDPNNCGGEMSWSAHLRYILGLAENTEENWQTLEALIHPDERSEVMNTLLAAAEHTGHNSFQIEHRCIHSDGRIIWVENRGLAHRDENGQTHAISGVIQDITERKRAETDLINSEQRFHDVAAITGESIFELDAEGYITYLSGAAKQIYGYDPEELIGKLPIQFYPKSSLQYDDWIAAARKDHGWKNTEREITRKDGTVGWFKINGRAILDSDESIIGFRGAVSDITEHYLATNKLMQSERRISEMIRITGGCIFDLDTQGCITYVSENALRLFGAAPEDMIGKPTHVLAPALKSRHHEWLDAIRNSDGGLETEFQVSRINGQPDIWLRTTCRALTNDAGVLIGYRGIAFDVTTRKQAALEIINAKKAAEATAEERARFLSTMSHEIRTPLNAMIGMTDLLLDMPQNEEQKCLTNSANTAGRHLLELVNDILDFSKLDAGKLEVETKPFDLQHEIMTVHDMLASTASKKGLKFKVNIHHNAKGSFSGDPSRIRQILVNLVGNAIKFTTKGSVTIHVKKTKTQNIRFAVTDTGTGIEQTVLPTLFQDFSQADSSITRKFGGTGLGLAICKRLTEVMCGEIGIQSKPGVGSTFWFEVPLPRTKVAKLEHREKAEQKPASTHRQSLHILVAEDNPANQMLIKTILTRMEHEITVVDNGIEAVETALAENFDVILMDVQMPELDGVSATQCLREAGCHTPVIALTAHVIAEEEEKFSAAGMDDWLSKPFDARKLAERMYYWAKKGPQSHILKSKKTS